ncbi:NUDIX hydrolase [Candidatus Desulfovibrio trichonymphae]|uniref:NUDIX hydrolase n=1 Tax=Candidatus Desulfovibrio trichonymphae TaxID=1725232 RepID=A0A1J1DV99_9BACT|nr:NUDIX hydrolase [Candidatus Desulfovibrio trichonymphae]BAV91780.1 NUDIX hydrolase [Candidatus Desulfovibrio trichonymphae]GHU92494.1 hypothetical protein AGMMS49925_11010 [Deltaproteobacteria bacterium]GHU93862.1 hypothetical protein AGMMS49974_02270 [Deltaproteobacteria bacterium]GHV00063.1 hypothetical protein AGMMS50248_09170 [Deltaproteobacteria bacterium]
MTTKLYPGLRQTQRRVEIVDSRNMPIGIMDYKNVLHQRLPHRTVALLLRDACGRVLLTLQPQSGWSFSSFSHVPAGQSAETRATTTLHDNWNLRSSRIVPIGIFPPCMENRQSFTTFFEARLSAVTAAELAVSTEHHLLLDYDELKGMNTHFKDMLTPYMRIIIQNGYIRPF